MNAFDALVLLVALVVILAGAELFTNGIEWFGRKLNLAEGAVGSVLAAVGTALPETMIPIVAILFAASPDEGGGAAHEIGVGSILGAPFMLSTLAMFVTGLAVVLYRRRRATGEVMPVSVNVLGKDIRYFFIAYGIAVAVAFVPIELIWVRWVAAAALLLLYVVYVRAHFVSAVEEGHADELPPLRFRRLDPRGLRVDPHAPRLRVVNLQVLAALGLILAGAVFFVDAVEHIAEAFHVNPAILALVIAPIATELPEKFNSILWIRQGKDTLAMGNITGAMVFQSCIPTIVALLFAAEAWVVTEDSLVAFISAGIAFVSTAAIFLPMVMRNRLTGRALLIGGAFYLGYLALVGAEVSGLI